MPLVRMTLAYDGTRFHGFQRQFSNQDMNERASSADPSTKRERAPKRPHWDAQGIRKGCAISIQDCFEDMLVTWTGESVQSLNMRFAGRTDKGVHAKGQVIAVELPASILWTTPTDTDDSARPPEQNKIRVAPWELARAMNSRLPVDIAVTSVQLEGVDPLFDPRRSVQYKIYSYTLKYRRKVWSSTADGPRVLLPICSAGPHSFKDPFDSPCLWVCPWALDDTHRSDLGRRLQGQHNFTVFVHRQERSKRSHVMTLENMTWTILSETTTTTEEEAPVVLAQLSFRAVGFRRGMVRNLVGYAVDVCRGLSEVTHLSEDDLWSGREDVARLIHAAPASGLCLEKVHYQGDSAEN